MSDFEPGRPLTILPAAFLFLVKRRDRRYQAGRSKHWVSEEPEPSRDRPGDGVIVHVDERREQGRLVDDREAEFDNIPVNRA